MDLVVAAGDGAVGAHEERGVIHVEAGAVGVQRGGARNHRSMHGKRQVRRAFSRRGSLSRKGAGDSGHRMMPGATGSVPDNRELRDKH